MVRNRRAAGWVAVGLVAAMVVVPVSPAAAYQTVTQTTIVSDNPADYTPNVTDGEVDAVVQAGNKVILGGTFTQVQNAGDTSTTYVRNYILAFDATTGLLDQTFVPTLDGQVTSLALAPDGQSVYLGGAFNNVNGVFTTGVARLNVADGTAVKGFKPPVLDAMVQDLKLNNGTLYIGGFFTQAKKAGVIYPRSCLAALDPATGDVLPSVNSTFAGTSHGGVTQVYKIDITPDGSRMVVIGNFSTIDGQDRMQMAMFDLTSSPVQLANWQTNALKPLCYTSFEFYIRDVEFSPDGSYFILGNSGGAGSGPPTLCDTVSRWETAATGTALSPTWVEYTGGDSTFAVGVTGAAVYVGGHMRWENNPFGRDSAGQGAVSREGIAALDPVNGLPFSWNPTRIRGKGVLDFFATNQGLWVASDTDHIGQNYEYHGRIAFFPLAGGTAIPSAFTGSLPTNVYQLGSPGGASTSPVLYRVNAGGPRLLAGDTGPDWQSDTSTAPAPYHNSGSTTESWSTVGSLDSSVPAGTPTAVFSSDRVDPLALPEMSWQFPVTAGTPLQVRLYFANRSSSTAQAGKRYFDVSIDGTTVLNNFDIVAAVGSNKGMMKAFNITSDGTVNIDFKHERSDPLVDAIEIVRTDVPAPTGLVSTDTVRTRAYDGTTAGALKSPPAGGIAWHSVRGAVMIGDTVYTGWQDGNFYSRTYDGSTWGPATVLNVADQITPMTTWHSEVPNITSMFFWNGRLYYTLAGSSALLYRYFERESGIVGAQEFTAVSGNLSDIDWTNVQGSFLVGSQYYFVTNTDGVLHRSTFTNGAPVAGTAVSVSGPGIDGVDWRARGLFLGTFGVFNNPPTASFTSSCSGATCSFDATASGDDGGITAYSWSFGDGQTGSGATTTHTYTKGKTYTVTLTVTDTDGATASTTGQVTPLIANVLPTASFTSSCSALACAFDASASNDPDGTITAYAWSFGDGTQGTGVTTSHGYAVPGTYHVTLTVTDDSGGTATATNDVQATAPSTPITFVGRSSANGNVSTASVAVPSGVAAGDALVLVESDNNNAVSVTGPAGVTGWTVGPAVPNGTATTRMWSKVATAGDVGATVTFTLSATSKIDVELLAYHGTSATTPVSAVTSASDSTTVTTHQTPTASVTQPGSWVLSFWDDKSSTTTTWTPPAGQVLRGTSIGSGTAHMSSLETDTGATVATGSYGGLAATTDDAAKATMLTIVLAPLP